MNHITMSDRLKPGGAT